MVNNNCFLHKIEESISKVLLFGKFETRISNLNPIIIKIQELRNRILRRDIEINRLIGFVDSSATLHLSEDKPFANYV